MPQLVGLQRTVSIARRKRVAGGSFDVTQLMGLQWTVSSVRWRSAALRSIFDELESAYEIDEAGGSSACWCAVDSLVRAMKDGMGESPWVETGVGSLVIHIGRVAHVPKGLTGSFYTRPTSMSAYCTVLCVATPCVTALLVDLPMCSCLWCSCGLTETN